MSNSNRGINARCSRKPVAKKTTPAASVTSSYGLGSIVTIAPLAPTSHMSPRCSPNIRGADVTGEGRASAVGAYAIISGRCSVGVFVFRYQRERGCQKTVEIEQNGPILDVIQIDRDTFVDLVAAVDCAAPAVDLRPPGD